MTKAQARIEAFKAVEALVLPPEWSPLVKHLTYTGWRHRSNPDGQLHFAALGTAPGTIEVGCCGMTILCRAKDLTAAVEMCLDWHKRVAGSPA